MVAYSVFMFLVAAVFLVLCFLIYRGNTNLIHGYHQTRVKASDKKEYGKSFAKAMFCIVLALAASGLIALLGESAAIVTAAVLILLAGLAASIVMLVKVQKKYNGGIF